jgi:hypothetical protein
MRNVFTAPSWAQKAAIPVGVVGWLLPRVAGDMASRFEATGGGALAGAGALGINSAATLDGIGSITNAFLALVVSAVANLVGSGSLTSDIVGRLEAAADLAGSGDATGAAGALAELLADLTGEGDASGTSTAQALMSAIIRGYGDLTPEGIRDSVWSALASQFNIAGTMGAAAQSGGSGGGGGGATPAQIWQHVIESGLTAEQIMRVMLAVLAGTTTGAGTSTESFMSVDGSTARVLSTNNDADRVTINLNGA